MYDDDHDYEIIDYSHAARNLAELTEALDAGATTRWRA
jgi:hypothetical protein